MQALDLPAAVGKEGVEAHVLDDGPADDDARDVEAEPAGDARHRQAGEPGDQAPRRGPDIGRLLRPVAERAVEVELARLDLRREAGIAAEVDRHRPGEARRPVGRPLRHHRAIDEEPVAGEGEAAFAPPAGRPGGLAVLAGRDHLADGIGAGIAQAVGAAADDAVGGDRKRQLRRRHVGLDAQRAVLALPPGGELEGDGDAVLLVGALDPPRPGERAGGDRRVDAAEDEVEAGLGVAVGERAVADLDVVEDDLVGVERLRRFAPDQPVDEAGIVGRDRHHRLVEPHGDDADLALKQRHQLDGDGEFLHRHHRLAFGVADLDIGEGERRRGQDRGLGRADDVDRLAEDLLGLGLEIRLVVVPVDEPRADQRGEQGDHHEAPEDQQ